MKLKIFLMGCSIAVWGLVSIPVAAEDNYAGLYQLKPGDTPESVAEKLLGDAELANLLLEFNKLDRSRFGSRTNQFISVPDVALDRANRALAETAAVIDQAVNAQAETYAAIELKEAQLLLQLAQSARKSGGFDKSRQQAALARLRADEAIKMSSERSRKSLALTVVSASGGVFGDTEDISGRRLAPGEPHLDLKRVETEKGRALISLGAHSKILLHADTSLSLNHLHYDERSGVESITLVVDKGRIEWQRETPAKAASRLQVVVDELVTIEPGSGLVAKLSGSATSLSVFEGQVNVGSGLGVAAGLGLVWNQGKAGEITPLPEIPALVIPEQGLVFAKQTPTIVLTNTAGNEVLVDLSQAGAQNAFVELDQQHASTEANVDLELLPAGDYLVRLMAYSPDGLFSIPSPATPLSIRLNLDVTMSVTPLALDGGSNLVVSANHLIQAAPTQAESSVVSIEYQIDEGPFEAVGDGFILFEPGIQTVRVRGVSAEGETGAAVEQTFLVDKQAPDIQLIVQTGFDAATELEQTLVSLEARDPHGVATIEFKLNDGPYVAYERVMKIQGQEPASFTYRATDRLGNQSRPRSVTVNP